MQVDPPLHSEQCLSALWGSSVPGSEVNKEVYDIVARWSEKNNLKNDGLGLASFGATWVSIMRFWHFFDTRKVWVLDGKYFVSGIIVVYLYATQESFIRGENRHGIYSPRLDHIFIWLG